ncbi:MAG: hypothetical protein LBF54_00005 [Holosporaceae bacterium]|jgi:hypothetical protein|nr:hypothetical protein [Holosporaceae bacterium]
MIRHLLGKKYRTDHRDGTVEHDTSELKGYCDKARGTEHIAKVESTE